MVVAVVVEEGHAFEEVVLVAVVVAVEASYPSAAAVAVVVEVDSVPIVVAVVEAIDYWEDKDCNTEDLKYQNYLSLFLTKNKDLPNIRYSDRTY